MSRERSNGSSVLGRNRWWLAALCVLVAGLARPAEPLNPEETRGRQIYLQGESVAGPAITARVGQQDAELDGRLLACASCHGRDGHGRPEGGLAPSNITWAELSKPYGHMHPLGRSHGPFNRETLAAAVTGGLDPAGNPLDAAMPRYRMAAQDLADLLAYLRRIDDDADPGLTETSVRLGVILPAGEAGRAIRQVLAAHFDQRNAEGGHYGRRVELAFADAGSPVLAQARWLIQNRRVFAIAGFSAALDQDQLADLVREAGVPLLAPSLAFADPANAVNPFTFYLLSGLEDQAAVLVSHGARAFGPEGAKAVILHAPGEPWRSLSGRLAARLAAVGAQSREPMEYGGDPQQAAAVVARLRQEGVGSVLYLGPDAGLGTLLAEAAAKGWRPRLLLPGALAGPSVVGAPPSFRERLFLAYPTVPADRLPQALSQVARLTGRQSAQYTQVLACAVAKVMEEGLRRAGRRLSRENLLSALETLDRYDTGLTPSISFGRSRRIGSTGAHVVRLQSPTVPQAAWVEAAR